MSPLARLSDASVRVGSFELGPISVEVRAGEIVALVGPNGAGKSSILRLIAGDLRPASGECWLGERAPADLRRRDVAARLSWLRQASPPRLPLTVEEFVLHGRWIHLGGWKFAGARDLAVAREALDRCSMGEMGTRDIRTLSGGELQRVQLARALAQGSRLLMLDEPTTHLDPGQRARILRLLRSIVGEGRVGVLIVSHDLDLVAAGCDRVGLVAGGRLLADGEPSRVLTPVLLERAFGCRVALASGTGPSAP